MPSSVQNPPSNFKGYSSPNYTPIPDIIFDEQLAFLSGIELKVLFYICRRTFGFKKDSDNISIDQMVDGIVTKDGKRLDYGTGLSRPSVIKAVTELINKNYIIRARRKDLKNGDLPSSYMLNLGNTSSLGNNQQPDVSEANRGELKKLTPPVLKKLTPGVKKFNPQETVKQETENTTTKETVRLSEKDAVVADLISFGISQKVSENLSNRFSPDYISEKIEFLRFLLEREKTSVKRPAAWLRKAIEDGYTAPDGYLPLEERERRVNEEKQRKRAITEAQKAHLERIEQQQKQQIGQKAASLQKLFEQYDTNASDLALWTQAQETMTYQGISAAISSSLHLLKIQHEKAILFVGNEFVQRLIKPEVREKIEKILSDLAKRPLTIEFLTQGRAEEGQME